jgi:DUF1680 family protein
VRDAQQLRLTRMVFQDMPLGGIADFYEHALYNGILASQDRRAA